ncbi:MAG TPA: GNAT family N-acetyltransferase [Candidatus Babeliales bacterium]|nr:GNAT family N-acetyltransferase [Candidatus Babeliales bacterium]
MEAIRGNKVILRELHRNFFKAYTEQFTPLVRSILHVPSVEHELLYLEQRLHKMQAGKTLFYCVFDSADNHLIGGIEIRDRLEHFGQLYSWLNECYWGNGRYQEALGLAAQSYFSLTQQRYFTAHVDVTNQRSYYALKKCGFAPSGFVNGPYGKQYSLLLRRKM